jgi:hypothetical protein
MAAVQFSEVALALLRFHFSGQSLMMGGNGPESLPGHTADETRAAYADLVAAGYMIAFDTRTPEPHTRYWLTLTAIERKDEWLRDAASSGRRNSN